MTDINKMNMNEMDLILEEMEEKKKLSEGDIKVIKEIEGSCGEGSWMSGFEVRCWELLKNNKEGK